MVRVHSAEDVNRVPVTVSQALSGSESHKWREAMQIEMNSMYKNDVWELVPLSEGRQVIGCKWIFKRKTGADGSVNHYKARLVAQGYSQQQGLDYDETLSPVIHFESLRALVSFAVQKNLTLHLLDITYSAFLNGYLGDFYKSTRKFY